MNIIVLDFESHFSDDYTLSKMTTESYIRDSRFEVLGCGIKWCMDKPPLGYAQCESRWYGPREVYGDDKDCSIFKCIDWSSMAVLCHHAQFDGLILSHHFGIKPKYILDTLSMARLLLGNHLSVSLDSLAKHFGLAAKSVPYNLFKGKHWHELTPEVQTLVANGCLHDIELTYEIFCILAKSFPAEEYKVVDATVRMFTEPVLVGDIEMLGRVWQNEAVRKRDLLRTLAIGAEELQSAEKFKALLEAEGVEIEYKDGKNGLIPCFAKTDEFMKGLLEHENPTVRSLVEARLDMRSTIEQTRAERLGFMAARGNMPVYLRYSGAHTTRWSGGDGVNWQNFPRGGDIRRSIMAPKGYLIAAIDLSQIEARILDYIAGQWDSIERFRNKEDPYIGTASAFYGEPVDVRDKLRRGLGKVLKLACGFGLGWQRLQITCRQGPMGAAPILLTDDEAQKGIAAYRSTHPHVVQLWKDAGRMLARLAGGQPTQWGPVTIRDRCIILPNGARIIYDTLEFSTEWNAWRVKKRNGWTKLYGGKLVENLIQALARVVFSQAMLRIAQRGFKVVNLEHDKIAVLVKDDDDKYTNFDFLKAEMTREPPWLPGIPLACEGELNERYEPL